MKRNHLLLLVAGVAVALTAVIDSFDAVTWWHVALAWLGAIIAVMALLQPPRQRHGWKQCPECHGEGTIAFVNDPGDWVVTCHGYFWTLTDEDLFASLEAVDV